MDLFRYAIGRVAQALPLILILILLTFFIIHLAPGDPVAYMLSGAPNVPPEILQIMRHQLGLDQPIQVQLWIYLRNLATGN
jgi:peptide/nickel transport system permease protein